MMNKSDKKKLYISYTTIFIVFSLFILSFYYLNGKSLTYGGDDYRQAYKALIYYSKYLRTIFNNFFVNHSFIIPQWDFNIAEGSDILHSFNTGLIGDPFSFFCFLFDENHMYIFYDFMRLFRPFCAGLAFIYLCLYFRKENWIAVLSGAISYSFCFGSVYSLLEYPFMDTPMIFLPFVIVGVEKVINNEKPYTLVLGVFISALSNFYFFYSIVLLTITYTLVRLIINKISIKAKMKKIFEIALWSFLGTLMAAILVLPIVYSFVNYGRLSTSSYSLHLLYPLSSYRLLLPCFTLSTTGFSYSIGGYALPCLLAVVYMFKERDNKTLLTLFICGFVFAISPIFGRIFNGFSYPSTRWCRLFALLVCYISVNYFDNLKSLGKEIYKYLVVIIVYYLLCIILDQDNIKIQIVLCIITICLLIFINLYKKKKCFNDLAILSTTLLTIFASLFISLSPSYWNFARDGVDFENLGFDSYKEVETISSIEDNEVWRYSGNELNDNESILGNHSATNFYWSVSNDNVIDFRSSVAISDHSCFHYTDYNNKSSLMSLASVKYFIVEKDDDNIPFGYGFYKTYENYDIYINKNALPYIYSYSNSMSRNEWENLNFVRKQEALLKSVVLDNCDSSTNNIYSSRNIDYIIDDNDGFIINENKLIVKEDDSILNINFDYQGEGEYYFVISNLQWTSDKQETWQDHLYTNIKVNTYKTSNTIYYKNPEHTRYSNRHNFSINMGYFNNEINEVELAFPDSGEFTYDSIEIIYLPLEEQTKDIEDLKNLDINNLMLKTNAIEANINIDEDKIVVISVPYSEAWTAYVDGEEAELLKANVQYIGLKLDAGNHEIVIKYKTPLLKEGAIISLISSIVFIVYVIINKKKDEKY